MIQILLCCISFLFFIFGGRLFETCSPIPNKVKLSVALSVVIVDVYMHNSKQTVKLSKTNAQHLTVYITLIVHTFWFNRTSENICSQYRHCRITISIISSYFKSCQLFNRSGKCDLYR